jgi:stearoyl-CoA desaturase (delta-9 desaturase)
MAATTLAAVAGTRRYGIQPGLPSWVSATFLLERHLGALWAICFVPLNASLVWLFLGSYVIRMWALEAGYHRYFSHRSFCVSRAGQFVLALLGAQVGQRGALYWAYVHRLHHRTADTSHDYFSPVANSFAYAYIGWMRDSDHMKTDLDAIADFARFPELRWLNRFQHAVMLATGGFIALAGYLGWFGSAVTWWSALAWGYFVPLTLVTHSVLLINTLCHYSRLPGGYRRYETPDASLNRHLLSFLTLGAAYHNNHHRAAALARAGFAWYEIDVTYYSLRLLQVLGLVRDVKARIPEDIAVEGGLRPPRAPARAVGDP